MKKNSYITGFILILFLLNVIPVNNCIMIQKDGTIYEYEDVTAEIDFNDNKWKIIVEDILKYKSNNLNGSLSGFVNGSNGNPIENASITITCGNLKMKNSSDSTGYYIIDNVPIVDCYWNASASKIGYIKSSVGISIDVNTKCNFILGKTYYVDDDGGADYIRIQDAIDNASDRDIIFVYNGTYFENIIVNKSINLFGENKTSTIIDAENIGDVVSIFAERVHIKDFTIRNSGKSDYPYYENQGIFIESNGAIIQNNLIYNSEQGIFLNSSYGTIIVGNIVEKSNSHGILLHNSSINIIKNNSIFNFNYSGITFSISNENWILYNTIYKSSSYGNGIILSHANNNTLIKNAIFENSYGIEINHEGSKFNEIKENNFIDNQRNAKFYALVPDANNIWDGNFWGHARIFPKFIFGTYYLDNSRIWLNWFNIDWNPASEPYDI